MRWYNMGRNKEVYKWMIIVMLDELLKGVSI